MPKTEKQVKRYAEGLRREGLTGDEVADIVADGLRAGYESDFDDDALKRGRSKLAVEMAEMRVRDMVNYLADTLAFLSDDKRVRVAATKLAMLTRN